MHEPKFHQECVHPSATAAHEPAPGTRYWTSQKRHVSPATPPSRAPRRHRPLHVRARAPSRFSCWPSTVCKRGNRGADMDDRHHHPHTIDLCKSSAASMKLQRWFLFVMLVVTCESRTGGNRYAFINDSQKCTTTLFLRFSCSARTQTATLLLDPSMSASSNEAGGFCIKVCMHPYKAELPPKPHTVMMTETGRFIDRLSAQT